MIWYIVLPAAAIIVIIILIALTKPDQWTIQRQAIIPGPAAKVFPYMDDLHKFQEWSPWAKIDPNVKLTYGGPASGNGANFSWVGNSQVGRGTMTITESHPNDLLRCRLDFIKPMRCTNNQEFTLKPDNSQTIVTWTINGNSPFMFKLFLVFASADKMMGDQLERGLANLKGLVAG